MPRKNAANEAVSDILENPVPGDPLGRSGAELVALATFREALNGNLAAAREILDRVEGKVTDHVEVKGKSETPDLHERMTRLTRRLRAEAEWRTGRSVGLSSNTEVKS